MTENKHWCAKRIYTGARWDFSGHMCSRRGVIERNGKWWCKQHDPEAETAREEARAAERRREAEAKKAVHDGAKALAERLGAGTPEWFDGRHTGKLILTPEEVESLIARIDDGKER